MKVIPEKLMAKLGVIACRSKGPNPPRWPCPLHQDADGCLTATDDPIPFFSCINPTCRFRGDAASLVSMCRNITIKEAVDLFRKNGELADCLTEELSDADADAYVEAVNSQAVLKAYLSKCRRALRQCPEKSGIRIGLSQNNLKLLHPDVGMFFPSDEVPRCLREFLKPKYKRSCLILYPYTRDGEVTRIEVVDSVNPGYRHTVVVTHPTAGVFGEQFAGKGKKTFVAETPEMAALLYSRHAAISAKPFPVVSFRDYPLPNSFRDVTDMEAFTFSEVPISSEFLVRTLAAPRMKSSGSSRLFELRIVEGGKRPELMPATDIATEPAARKSYDIPYFLARRFAKAVAEDKGREVLEFVDRCQAPTFVKNLLRDSAKTQMDVRGGFFHDAKSTAGLISLLEEVKCGSSCDIELANGKVMRCSPDGIFAVRMSGNIDLLCNVGITVNSRVTSPKESKRKYEAFDCTVSARGDFPARKVRLMWEDLTTEKLRAKVQQAYSDMGMSPYIAFYGAGGFNWRDIVSKLAENCPVDKEELEPGMFLKGPPLELSKPVSGGSVAIGPVFEQ